MNYGVIENGVCTNIIVADALFAAKIGAVELVDGFGIGDLYDGNWSKFEFVKSAEELRMEYEDLVFEYIRKKYTQTDENKLVREFLADVESEAEFFEYHNYVEECKTLAYGEVYGEDEEVVDAVSAEEVIVGDVVEDIVEDSVVVEEIEDVVSDSVVSEDGIEDIVEDVVVEGVASEDVISEDEVVGDIEDVVAEVLDV